MADACNALQAVVDRDGAVLDSAAGPRAHPALIELRQCSITLSRLVTALRVPLGDAEDGDRPQLRSIRGVYGG